MQTPGLREAGRENLHISTGKPGPSWSTAVVWLKAAEPAPTHQLGGGNESHNNTECAHLSGGHTSTSRLVPDPQPVQLGPLASLHSWREFGFLLLPDYHLVCWLKNTLIWRGKQHGPRGKMVEDLVEVGITKALAPPPPLITRCPHL